MAHRVSKYIRQTMGFYPTSGEKVSPSEWATFTKCVERVSDSLKKSRILSANVRNKLDELRVIAQIEADELWLEIQNAGEGVPTNTFLVNKSACEAYAMTVALAIMGSFDVYRTSRKRDREESAQ